MEWLDPASYLIGYLIGMAVSLIIVALISN